MNVSDVCIVLLYRDRTERERERESLCSIVDRVMKEVNKQIGRASCRESV